MRCFRQVGIFLVVVLLNMPTAVYGFHGRNRFLPSFAPASFAPMHTFAPVQSYSTHSAFSAVPVTYGTPTYMAPATFAQSFHYAPAFQTVPVMHAAPSFSYSMAAPVQPRYVQSVSPMYVQPRSVGCSGGLQVPLVVQMSAAQSSGCVGINTTQIQQSGNCQGGGTQVQFMNPNLTGRTQFISDIRDGLQLAKELLEFLRGIRGGSPIPGTPIPGTPIVPVDGKHQQLVNLLQSNQKLLEEIRDRLPAKLNSGGKNGGFNEPPLGKTQLPLQTVSFQPTSNQPTNPKTLEEKIRALAAGNTDSEPVLQAKMRKLAGLSK